VSYQLQAGSLPADGASHRLSVSISPDLRADYPLTLTGFSIEYQLPEFGPHRQAALTVESVSPVSAAGQAGPPIPALWGAAESPAVSLSAPQMASWAGNSAYGSPTDLTVLVQGRGAKLTFSTGAGADAINDSSGEGLGDESAYATLTVTPPALAALPAIATSAFLASSGQHLGGVLQVTGLPTPVTVRLVGEVAQFPTISTPGGGIVVSEAALQAYSAANGGQPLPVTEWWTRNTGNPAFGPLPAGTTVTTLAGFAQSLNSQPLAVAPLRSLIAVAVVALLLAVLGFLVSVSSSKERGRDLAVLDALGATPGQLTRLLCLEQGMLSVPAAAGGLALGLLLSHLVIPAVTLTAQAAHPIPSVLVRIPLTPALAIAAAIAAMPILGIGISVVRRTGTMATLRAEEEM
jgi:hypothetical protein